MLQHGPAVPVDPIVSKTIEEITTETVHEPETVETDDAGLKDVNVAEQVKVNKTTALEAAVEVCDNVEN